MTDFSEPFSDDIKISKTLQDADARHSNTNF